MGKARTSAEPVRLSATLNLHVHSSMPGKEKERDRRMGGRAMKKVGKVTSSLFFFSLFFLTSERRGGAHRHRLELN